MSDLTKGRCTSGGLMKEKVRKIRGSYSRHGLNCEAL